MMLHVFNPDNYLFNVYAIPMLVTGTAIACLGFFVLTREHRSPLGISYLFMCLSISFFQIMTGLVYANQETSLILPLCKIASLAVIFIPLTILIKTLTLFVLSRQYRSVIAASVVMSILFSISLFTSDLFISGLEHFFWGWYVLYGPLGYAFMAYFFGIMLFILRLYWQEFMNCTTKRQKKRYHGLLTAFIGGYLGSLDFLPTLGIPIYPFGYLFIGFFIAVSAYTIARYQLKDITLELAASQILDTMQGAVIVTSMAGMIRVINRVALEMLGSPRSELIGKDLMQVLPVPAEFTAAIKAGKRAVSGEMTWQGKKSRYEVNMSASLLADTRDGEPEGIVYVATDITRLKQIQAKLTLSEERQRLAHSATNQGWFDLNVQTGETVVSPTMEQMLGYAPGEFTWDLQFFFNSIHPDDRPVVQQAYQECLASGGPCTMVYRRKMKYGQWIWLSSIGKIVEYDREHKPLRMIGVHADISARKEAEEQLKQSLSLLKSTLQSTADGILVVADNGRITDYNEQFVKLWGIPKSILDLHDDQQALDFVLAQLKNPEQFIAKVRALYADTDATSFDILDFKDGRVFERYSQPQRIEGKPIGRVFSFRDITERKRAEEARRKSEELSKTVHDNIEVGIAVIGPDMRIRSMNRQMRRWFPHVDPGVMPICHQTFNEPPRAEPCSYCPTIRTLRDGKVHEAVTETPTATGVRNYRVISSPLLAADGSVEAAIEMVDDITERRQAEILLQESEERYRQLVDQSPDAICVHQHGKYVFVNRAAVALFGAHSERELIGMPIIDTVHPAYREQLRRRLKYISGTHRKPDFMELKLIRFDGFVLTSVIISVPIQYHGGPAIQVVIHDVTSRKLAEDKLRRNAREQQIILNTTDFGIVYVKDRTLVWTNPAFRTMFGYSRYETAGLDTRQLYADVRDYERVGLEGYARIATGNAYTIEVKSKKKNGSTFWLSLSGRAVNPDDASAGSIWMLQDISERKSAAEALQKKTHQLENLTTTLEQRVKAEVALRLKNEQILFQQSKLAAIGETLGAIAHQWRQPLNALGLIIQNLKDAYAFGDLTKESIEQTVRNSMSQIQHMSKTIDDFRNFFQPDKERTSFGAIRAVGDVLELFSAQLRSNDIGCRITCQVHGITFKDPADIVQCEETMVLGFRNEFEHVILNLVNNARESILENRGRGHGPDQGVLSFDFHNQAGKIVIRISDNGGGIDRNSIDRIFEPYFTTKDAAKGTGLGLYMSKVIIEDHMKGTLVAANDEQGAVFTIVLAQADERRTS